MFFEMIKSIVWVMCGKRCMRDGGCKAANVAQKKAAPTHFGIIYPNLQMTLTIYTYPNNPRVHKALIAAAYGGVEVEVAEDFKMGETNKTKEFLAMNPAGKVPVLSTPQGAVFESNAIARYIARLAPQANLLGKCFYSQAVVDQWVDYISFEIQPPAGIVTAPIQGWGKPTPEGLAKAKEAVDSNLALLDQHLVSNTFLVGNYITLADIVGYAALVNLFKLAVDPRKSYPRVARWFNTLVNQPEFKGVIGDFKFVDGGIEEKEEKAAPAKADGGKKDNKKKGGDKPKKETPKAEAKKPEPAAGNDEDDDEPKPVKPKDKNPLDSLPKSNMILDNVKRLFSNEDFAVAEPKFWADFDAEGYSIWQCAYNYNSENKVYFMTCNLIGGYLQRLDSLRKYGYGVLNVTGAGTDKNPPFDIVGLFIVRGKEIPFELKDCPDSEYYTWTKIDHVSGKARFAELWDSEKIDGKNVLERRFFK
jgi:elongation factor 1-gamma